VVDQICSRREVGVIGVDPEEAVEADWEVAEVGWEEEAEAGDSGTVVEAGLPPVHHVYLCY